MQKQERNFHSISCLKEYFKLPPLEKIAKLQHVPICTVARNFKFNHVFQASAPGRICNVLVAKKDLSPRHQHCTDEAQKAETVLSAVKYSSLALCPN